LAGDPNLSSYSYESIGAGLAAVWARENSREGLFDAMQKKETYATTGTRIIVRFFGGWDYGEDEVFRPDAVSNKHLYSWSVPSRTPGPAISIGSRSSRGGSTTMANGRSAFTMWRYPMVGRSAPMAAAGRAFYYARVLEIPTPTWQAYDSKYYGDEMPDTVQMKGQERAYTSPIWYTP
jgi:hypothetical protein